MNAINRKDWTQHDAQGYNDRHGIEVHKYDDGTTRINASLYADRDLIISEDQRRIDHIGGAWYLTR